ncbi:hypothetical protein REPUB_Repub05bG0079800 [Reevesia pubescens]
MTRLSLVLLIVLFALIFQPKPFEARKLLNNLEKKEVPSFKFNFVGIILPKEPTKILPASDNNINGHTMANNERLLAIHLAKIDRVLQSTPSPGGGHSGHY